MTVDTISKRSIFFIGMPGVGKSSVGCRVAECLNCPWLDTDSWVTREVQSTIEDIFRVQGEAYYRALEAQCIQMHQDGPLRVVSCGGGLVTIPGMMDRLREYGVTVYLRASIQTLVERLRLDTTVRPLLVGDVVANLERLYAQRHGLYEQADTTIDTDKKTLNAVVQEVCYFLGK